MERIDIQCIYICMYIKNDYDERSGAYTHQNERKKLK